MNVSLGYWINLIARTSASNEIAQSGWATNDGASPPPPPPTQTGQSGQVPGTSPASPGAVPGNALADMQTTDNRAGVVLARTLASLAAPAAGLLRAGDQNGLQQSTSASTAQALGQTAAAGRSPAGSATDVAPQQQGTSATAAAQTGADRQVTPGQSAIAIQGGRSPDGIASGIPARQQADGGQQAGLQPQTAAALASSEPAARLIEQLGAFTDRSADRNNGALRETAVFDVFRRTGGPAVPADANRVQLALNVIPGATGASVADVDVSGHLADFMSKAMNVEAGQRGMLAAVIFNAAMIPGWPPQAPYVNLPAGRSAAVLSEMAKQNGMTDEEMMEYLAKLGVGNELRRKLRTWLDEKGEMSVKKAMGFLTLVTLIVATVYETIKKEAERALEEFEEEFLGDRDDGGEPGPQMRRTRSKVYLK